MQSRSAQVRQAESHGSSGAKTGRHQDDSDESLTGNVGRTKHSRSFENATAEKNCGTFCLSRESISYLSPVRFLPSSMTLLKIRLGKTGKNWGQEAVKKSFLSQGSLHEMLPAGCGRRRSEAGGF